MNPSAVAGCDCNFTITMQLTHDPAAPELKLYRRWDNLNTPNPLVEIGAPPP
jgi:hypothetical protein